MVRLKRYLIEQGMDRKLAEDRAMNQAISMLKLGNLEDAVRCLIEVEEMARLIREELLKRLKS